MIRDGAAVVGNDRYEAGGIKENRSEERWLAAKGWNVVGGVEGKINTMSNCKLVFNNR